MRLLVLQGTKLAPSVRVMLETAILAGPPRHRYPADVEPEQWQRHVGRSVWFRLAKLREGGAQLGDVAAQRIDELSTASPEWRLAGNEQDEFSHWMSGTGDPDYEASRDIDIAPRKRKELVAWLKRPAPEGSMPFRVERNDLISPWLARTDERADA